MKRKILICAMLLAMIGFTAPTDNYAAGDQERRNRSSERSRGGQDDRWGDDNRRGRRRSQRRNRNTYGYKNYGQYRRTQVGNRRYRLVRRSYWRDGSRLTRLVRVYY